jgi:uncharacterized protein YjbI with pentapeptide repeats
MSKIKLQIKNRSTDSILFEYESEKNTIKETVVNAVKSGANLYDADLRDANLYDADLRGANLGGAYLGGANLYDADLRDANLGGANLRGANLYDADLRDANLRDANLYDADLRGANLRGAYLRGANLYDADLRDANLRGANLYDADLRDANLRGANLRGANLRGADLGKGKVKTFAVFTGIYQYTAIPYILETGECRVKMGCHDRSVAEWDADFWNNNDEFPNNGSVKSNLRVIAYDTAKKWIELNKNL